MATASHQLKERSKSDRRWNRSKHSDLLLNRRTVSLYSRFQQKSCDEGLVDPFGEPVTFLNNVIRISDSELANKRIELKYSARMDQYKRPTDPECPRKPGWKSLVFAERNMDLITEHRQQAQVDHVMVYLSRNPGTTSSFIRWKFNFTDAGLRIDRFALRFLYETSEDGNVRVYLERDEEGGFSRADGASSRRIPVFSSSFLRTIPEVKGWSTFSLIAEMSCKRGACSFNHSQLFLQERSRKFFEKEFDKYPLKIDINFS